MFEMMLKVSPCLPICPIMGKPPWILIISDSVCVCVCAGLYACVTHCYVSVCEINLNVKALVCGLGGPTCLLCPLPAPEYALC